METISVCVPVYNAGPYIGATLESILAQTWRSIRVLVQDNASTDGTAGIVRAIQAKDERVSLAVNPANFGYCGNIRTVVERAETEVVCVFHADDIYRPRLIEAEYAALKKGGAAAAFSSYLQFYGNPGKVIPYPIGPDFRTGADWFSGGLDDYLPILLARGNPFACPTLMTYRKILLGLGAFTDRYPSNEDMDLWIRYLKAGHRLAIARERNFLYRRSAGQGSAYWDNRDELPVYFDLMDEELVSGAAIDPALASAYARSKAKAYLVAGVNALKSGKKEKARGMRRLSEETRRMGFGDGPWFLFQRSLGLFRAYKGMLGLMKRMLAK